MKQKKLTAKKTVLLAMCMSMLFSSVTALAADSYTTAESFSKVVLPESSSNTTLKTGTKATDRKYGRAKITSYTNCSEVSCWFRSKLSDGYHYWLPYMVTIDDTSYHKINYCDAKSRYYSKGVEVDLRAENADDKFNFYVEKVSGKVSFN